MAVWVAWYFLKFRRLVSLLSEFARHDQDGTRYDHPDAQEMSRYAQILGFQPLPDEYEPGNEAAYPHRVFGIDAVRVREPGTGEWVVRHASPTR